MNPYNFAVLFFAFCTFFIGLFIMFKRQDNIGNRYFIFSIFVTIWGIGTALEISQASTYESSLFAARIANLGALFIPATWFHFVIIFSDSYQKCRKPLLLLYVVSLLISTVSFSPFFISTVKPIVGFKYFSRLGLIYHVFTVIFFTIVPFSYLLFIQKMKRVRGGENIQLKGFVIATAFGFLGGSLTFLPAYDIPLPQYGLFLMPIYPFIIAYFMTRHRLFDIEQAIESFQREKLATIGLIASSINHEIRNPLYAAKCILENDLEAKETEKGTDNEILSVPFSSPVSGKQRNASERALKQIARALDVITKLNRFAKPAEDKDGREQRANIQEALKNVLDLVSYEFSLDKIQIINNIPDDLPEIQADPRQLEEILFNLIVNACHAMSRKLSSPKSLVGDPSLDSRQKHSGMTGEYEGILTIQATSHDSRITITIADTGCGIPPDQTKHLFEPFHTTKGEKGTGLGLYITKQLVERNGGKISVTSKEGRGTQFNLGFNLVRP